MAHLSLSSNRNASFIPLTANLKQAYHFIVSRARRIIEQRLWSSSRKRQRVKTINEHTWMHSNLLNVVPQSSYIYITSTHKRGNTHDKKHKRKKYKKHIVLKVEGVQHKITLLYHIPRSTTYTHNVTTIVFKHFGEEPFDRPEVRKSIHFHAH